MSSSQLVLSGLHEVAQQFYGQGEDDGAVLLRRDVGQGLQVPARQHNHRHHLHTTPIS